MHGHVKCGCLAGLVVAVAAIAACGGTDRMTGPVSDGTPLAAKRGTTGLPSATLPKVKTIVLCGQDYPKPDKCFGSEIFRVIGLEEGDFPYATFRIQTDRVEKPEHDRGGIVQPGNNVWFVSGRDWRGAQLSPGVHTYALNPIHPNLYVEILIDPGVAIGPWTEEDGFDGIRDFGIFEGKTPLPPLPEPTTLPSEGQPGVLTLFVCSTAPCFQTTTFPILYPRTNCDFSFPSNAAALAAGFPDVCLDQDGNQVPGDPSNGAAFGSLQPNDAGGNGGWDMYFGNQLVSLPLSTWTWAHARQGGGSPFRRDAQGNLVPVPFFTGCTGICDAYIEIVAKAGVVQRAGVFRQTTAP
jgi:hypothetical protein